MGKEENALMQQNAQAQISVSEQPLEAYKQRGAEEYGDERMARDKQKTEEARALRQAESLRHSLASGHMNRDLKSLARRNARAEERPASAPQEMSERQKKKRDKRKEKGLRRVRKQYGPGATEDTLPMAQRVAEYRKERREAGEDGPEDLES
ncbi:MAG: hypothetical protein LBP73_05890, partial [Clostridiales Family XIII bacterium]|nr:hypothetical protein [Clostridiales Family XIII bacterium]